MWSSNNQSNPKRLTTNLKQLKLAYKAPEPQPAPPSAISDISSTAESSTNPSTWRKELKLTRVVERERKKLSTATASSCSTSTSYSSTSSRTPPTPSDLPRLDDRLSMLDEKLEAVENMISARKQMFDVLGKDNDLLNLDLQREIKRNSQPPEPTSAEQTLTQPSMEAGTTQSATSESGGATDHLARTMALRDGEIISRSCGDETSVRRPPYPLGESAFSLMIMYLLSCQLEWSLTSLALFAMEVVNHQPRQTNKIRQHSKTAAQLEWIMKGLLVIVLLEALVQKTCSHHALQSKLQGSHTTLHSSLADTLETSFPHPIRRLQLKLCIHH
ncbi:hypothetical protein MJO28_010982 [Puccinia striiformis f. sp. tritici]|uniref:Uncharacterized protein n=1 Tax=Puccinia striiformis f. sp. tritici TaxID=168172 RepID=A0ACC0E0T9_9BASI|nr:hypothetical protein MJO28_010982 [Puccinia striiformis f. sp. tritici]